MRGKGSRRAIPAPESILPKTARPRGSGQITNAIPLLRHGEEVKNGFASLKAQAAPPVTASYAGINGQKGNDVPAEDLPVSAATYAKTIDYKGQSIRVMDQGYHFASTFFTTLEAVQTYVDGLEAAPKSLTTA